MRCAASLVVGLTLLAAACTPQPPAATQTPAPGITAPATAAVPPTETALLTATLTTTPNATATLTPLPGPQVCSPLQDVPIAELAEIVKNPFELPPPGQDSGHHGTDLAYYTRGTHMQMLGLPVYAAVGGRVAGVINDRPPYGNLVIIETPLDALTPALAALLPTPQPTPAVRDNRLTCPEPRPQAGWGPGQSLYLAYAHLDQPPPVKVGQQLACGEALGAVGTSGASVNPHLHLEARIGPAGAVFEAMSHYNAAASPLEIENYCLWRTSGFFQPFDPMSLFKP